MINSASSLATRLLSVTVLIWVQQYLLKRISVEEYSLLPIVYSLMIFLPYFSIILTGGIRRFVLESYAENDLERLSQIVSSMFPLLCVAGLFLFGVGAVLAWKIELVIRVEPEYVDEARIMLLLIVFVEALRLPLAAFSSGLYVKQRFVLENGIKLVTECVRLTLLFVLLFGVDVSVVSVVIASVVGGLLEVTSLFIVSRRLVPAQRFDLSKFDWSIVKELTRFGGWSTFYGFSGMIRKAADPIILNRWATPLDVTCFHLGALVPNRLEVIVNQSFLGSVSPVVVGLHADRQEEKLKSAYLRLGRYAMWGVLIIVAPFLVHFREIVRLYVGDTYLAAGTVLFLLLACYPMIYGNILHSSLANAKLKMRSLALRESVSALLNLSLTLMLVGYYGMGAIGSAIATFIVYGLGSILIFWPFGRGMVRATRSEVWREIVLPGITPFLLALLLMKLLAISFPVVSWFDIAASAALGCCLYLTVVWFVAKDIDRTQFKNVLNNVIH